MKNVLRTSIAFLITWSSVFAGHLDQVDKTDSNTQHVFVFKVDKEFRGGRVEVLSADGKRVTAQRLIKRKMIIDFCDVRSGVYTILIKKDDQVKRYEFVKK